MRQRVLCARSRQDKRAGAPYRLVWCGASCARLNDATEEAKPMQPQHAVQPDDIVPEGLRTYLRWDHRHDKAARWRKFRRGSFILNLPSHHSITSSASASTLSGISTPSAFAVARLMTRSILVASSTGMSAGFAPLRIRPA